MKPSTEDLHEKRISGYSVDEMSKETGISIWALYKRFQRMQSAESTQENNSEDDTIQKNIIANTNELQTRTSKWPDAISTVFVFVAILAIFFLYRKYNSKKIRNNTE